MDDSTVRRRDFLKRSATTIGAMGALRAGGVSVLELDPEVAAGAAVPAGAAPGWYQGASLNRVAFPMGGIGAGMLCLEGTGALSHVSVRNRPDVFNGPCIFAAIAVKGRRDGARVLEGPVPGWKIFGARGLTPPAGPA